MWNLNKKVKLRNRIEKWLLKGGGSRESSVKMVQIFSYKMTTVWGSIILPTLNLHPHLKTQWLPIALGKKTEILNMSNTSPHGWSLPTSLASFLNVLPLASGAPAKPTSLFPMVLPPLAFICTIPSFRNAWNSWNAIYPHIPFNYVFPTHPSNFNSSMESGAFPNATTKRVFLIVSKTYHSLSSQILLVFMQFFDSCVSTPPLDYN